MKFVKEKIRENITGEEIEYILIKENEGHILIFEYGNKIKIISIENERDIIRKIIELNLEIDYLSEILDEQEEELEELEKNLKQYKEE